MVWCGNKRDEDDVVVVVVVGGELRAEIIERCVVGG